jgi:hypothetical protein
VPLDLNLEEINVLKSVDLDTLITKLIVFHATIPTAKNVRLKINVYLAKNLIYLTIMDYALLTVKLEHIKMLLRINVIYVTKTVILAQELENAQLVLLD